jgi:hypothetical protein
VIRLAIDPPRAVGLAVGRIGLTVDLANLEGCVAVWLEDERPPPLAPTLMATPAAPSTLRGSGSDGDRPQSPGLERESMPRVSRLGVGPTTLSSRPDMPGGTGDHLVRIASRSSGAKVVGRSSWVGGSIMPTTRTSRWVRRGSSTAAACSQAR